MDVPETLRRLDHRRRDRRRRRDRKTIPVGARARTASSNPTWSLPVRRPLERPGRRLRHHERHQHGLAARRGPDRAARSPRRRGWRATSTTSRRSRNRRRKPSRSTKRAAASTPASSRTTRRATAASTRSRPSAPRSARRRRRSSPRPIPCRPRASASRRACPRIPHTSTSGRSREAHSRRAGHEPDHVLERLRGNAHEALGHGRDRRAAHRPGSRQVLGGLPRRSRRPIRSTRAVVKVTRNGISTGCGGGNYCPDEPLTRAPMAVFLLRAVKHAPDYQPPPATGDVFADVAARTSWATGSRSSPPRDITTGCGGGNYCPNAPINRAAMAVFLLRGQARLDLSPAGRHGDVFTDVPPGAFLGDWIEELAAEGITAGCGGGNFCPQQPGLPGRGRGLSLAGVFAAHSGNVAAGSKSDTRPGGPLRARAGSGRRRPLRQPGRARTGARRLELVEGLSPICRRRSRRRPPAARSGSPRPPTSRTRTIARRASR